VDWDGLGRIGTDWGGLGWIGADWGGLGRIGVSMLEVLGSLAGSLLELAPRVYGICQSELG